MRKAVIVSVLCFIEDNLEEEMLIDDIVRFSGYSRRTIHGLFIEYIGMSPGAYIRRRKLCRAANWLRLTSISGIQMAFALGFSGQQSFSREFKRYFGTSPREYRNSDVWDMSLLVLPLRLSDVPLLDVMNSQIINLPGMSLTGYSLSTEEHLPYRGDNRGRRWQQMIADNLDRSSQDLFFVSEVEVLPGGVERFKVNTFIGKEVGSGDGGKRKIINEGMYLRYLFSGTAEEYTTLSVNISMELLPHLQLKRRRGSDIEHFRYIRSDGELSCEIVCDYYVPVSY